MIVIQDFQDPYTLNVKQLMKCCVEEITPDGRMIPFCAYNSVGYREQVREQMSGVGIPTLVPNARQLQAMLETTRYGSKTVPGTGGNGHALRERDQYREGPPMTEPSAELTKWRAAPPPTPATSSPWCSARATTPAA